jgi:mRNA interferase HigB
MHIITRKRLREFYEKHPQSKSGLEFWYKISSKATWENFDQLRETFPSADLVKNFTVFNISGNRYQLIVFIDYNYQEIYIRQVLTHAEYDKNNWKQDSWFS